MIDQIMRDLEEDLAQVKSETAGVMAEEQRTKRLLDANIAEVTKAVAAGECQVAVANTYYYVRLMKSAKPEERAVAEKVGVVFPNQSGRGTHVNVSGAGVLKHAPHREAAVKFLEYLASDEAQAYFADGNNEYPAAGKVQGNRELASLGEFRKDSLNVTLLGKNQAAAQQTYDRAGWK